MGQLSQEEFEELISDIRKNIYGMDLGFYCSYVTHLDTISFVKEICNALESNTTITSLSFNKYLEDEGTTIIAELLKKNSTLLKVYLGKSGIKDKGAIAIAAALEKNSTLTFIDISHNLIKKEGAVAIAAALKKNATLAHIDLSCNDIGYKGTKAIKKALKINNSMTSLSMLDIGAGDRDIIRVLEKKPNITYVSLGGILNSDYKLQAVLKFNRTRKQSNVSSCIASIVRTKYENLSAGQKAFILNMSYDQKKLDAYCEFLHAPESKIEDPLGLVKYNIKYSEEDEVKEIFKRLQKKITADTKFMSNYFATLFEQTGNIQILQDHPEIVVKQDQETTILAVAPDNLTEIKQMLAFKITKTENNGIRFEYKINNKQKEYTKELTEYNKHVLILKDIGILVKNESSFTINLGENTLKKLQDYSFERDSLTKTLQRIKANEAQISIVLDAAFKKYNEHVRILKDVGIIVETNSGFTIDLNDDTFKKLRNYGFEYHLLTKALREHGASKKQISIIIEGASKPSTKVEEARYSTKTHQCRIS